MVECLTRDRGAAVVRASQASLRCVPSLVLVQPRKTRPCFIERLLMGRKESNQTKNPYILFQIACLRSVQTAAIQLRSSSGRPQDRTPQLLPLMLSS